MRLKLVWIFIVWVFMKMFGGTFETMKAFRCELKRGAPESVFAVFGFMLISLVSIGVVMLISAAVLDDTQTLKYIGLSSIFAACATLVYNIIKAAWECFVQERQDVIDMLRNS